MAPCARDQQTAKTASARGRSWRVFVTATIAVAALVAALVGVVAAPAHAGVLPSNCTMTWVGGSDGGWNDPGVWSSSDSSVVCIPAGVTVGLTSSDVAPLHVVVGAIFIEAGSMLSLPQLGHLTVTGPTVSKIAGRVFVGTRLCQNTIDGTGTIEFVAGSAFDWNCGRLDGPAPIILDAGATGRISTHFFNTLSKPLVNHGDLSIKPEVGINADRQFLTIEPFLAASSGPGGSLSSDGTLVVDTTVSDLAIGGGFRKPVDLAGTVAVIGGHQLWLDGLVHGAGSWSVAPGTWFIPSALPGGTVPFDATVDVGAGSLFAPSTGVWNATGRFSGAGSVCSYDQQLNLDNPDALASVALFKIGDCTSTTSPTGTSLGIAAGATARVKRIVASHLFEVNGGGTLNVLGDGDATTTDLQLGVEVAPGVFHAGGIRVVAGGVDLAPGATASLAFGSALQLFAEGGGSATFMNHGVIDWQNARLDLSGAAARFTNATDGTITVAPTNDADARISSGPPSRGETFVNEGRLNVSRFRLSVDNATNTVLRGAIDVAAGATLSIDPSAEVLGSLHLGVGATLRGLSSLSLAGRVDVDVAGPADAQHGLIVVDLNSTLAGALNINTAPTYSPQSDVVTLVRTAGTQTGQFTSVQGTFNAGLGTWTAQYAAHAASIVARQVGGGTVRIDATTPQAFLDSLTVINGNVVIDMTGIGSLSIPNLTTINGDLTIINLTGGSSVSVPKLSRVTGNVSITNDSTGAVNIGTSAAATLKVDGTLTLLGSGSTSIGPRAPLVIATTPPGTTTVAGVDSCAAFTGVACTSINVITAGSPKIVLDEYAAHGLVHVETGGGTTINLGTGTAAGTVDIQTGAGSTVNLGPATVDGNVTVTTGSGSTVNLGTSNAGDVVITTGDGTTVNLGSATVSGNATVTTGANGSITRGTGPTVGGLLSVKSGEVSAVTGATGTTISVPGATASMTAKLPAGSTTGNVAFSVSASAPPASAPGIDPSGRAVTVTPVGPLYGFTFAVPTLNSPANLTFDINLTAIDPIMRSAVLTAVAGGVATIGVASGAVPATALQAFAVCTVSQTPAANGCAAVSLLDAAGNPTTGTPATVRFAGIAGHFSTWGVVLLPQADRTPPTVSLAATGTQGVNGWFTGNVTVHTSGTDAGGIASCTADQLQTTDTAAAVFNGSCTDTAGNTGTAVPLTVKRDAAAPTSTASVVNGASQATVTLNAVDATSGVASTTYNIGGGPAVAYSSPIVITAAGTTVVTFRSIDNAGNREPDRTVSVTITPTVDACAAPGTVDNFNRADGRIGTNWTGTADELSYRIVGNKLQPRLGGPLLWTASLGATQSAAVTLSAIDPNLPQGLLLKAQGQTREGGVISVVYDPVRHNVVVSTLRTGSFSWTSYPAIGVTLNPGDRLGACATSTGEVRVYRNGTLLRTTTLSAGDQAFFNSRGGRAGIWTLLTPKAVLDDFAAG